MLLKQAQDAVNRNEARYLINLRYKEKAFSRQQQGLLFSDRAKLACPQGA